MPPDGKRGSIEASCCWSAATRGCSDQREPSGTLTPDSSADWLPFGDHGIPARAVRFRVVVTNSVDQLDSNTVENPLRLVVRNSAQRFGDRLNTLGDFCIVPHQGDTVRQIISELTQQMETSRC